MALENGQTLEKHAEFFNNTKALVVDMDDFTLECHIRELGLIAFEARARVLAASEEKRQRSAKKTKEEKEWILGPTGNQINVTDAINGVKERKQRQTRAEKDLARLKSLGIDSSIAEALIAEAIRKNTGAQVTTVSKPSDKVTAKMNHAANVDPRPVSKPFVNPFAKTPTE
jgi:ParB-like chromosome segregation protein Spo0J